MLLRNHVQTALRLLYGGFPREMGIPSRSMVNSVYSFLELVEKHHRISPVFLSVYKSFQQDPVTRRFTPRWSFRRFFLDIDSRDPQLSRDTLLRLLELLVDTSNEISFSEKEIAIVYTAGKGYHVYLLLSRDNNNPDLTTTNESKARATMYHLSLFIDKIISKLPRKNKETIDTHVIGDIERLSRVPGISRPGTSRLPIMLVPDDIKKHDISELYSKVYNHSWTKMAKQATKYYNSLLKDPSFNSPCKFKTIMSLNSEKNVPSFVTRRTSTTSGYTSMSKLARPRGHNSEIDKLMKLLKQIITPYMGYMSNAKRQQYLEDFLSPNPSHKTRVAVVLALLKGGLTSSQVINIIELINWEDYNRSVTQYQVHSLEKTLQKTGSTS